MEKIEGIVLSKKTYKEYDELIWVFTEEYGMISAIIRGSKRKNNRYRGELPIFSCVIVDIIVKQGLSIIGGFEVIDTNFKNDKQLLHLFLYAGQLSEFIQRIVPEKEAISGLFIKLKGLFSYAGSGQYPQLSLTYLQQLLLPYSGIMLELSSCASCQNKKDIIAFSYHYSGLLCKNCQNKLVGNELLDIDQIKVLVSFSRISVEKLMTLEIQPQDETFLIAFWDELYTEYLGIYLKSKKVNKSLKELEGTV